MDLCYVVLGPCWDHCAFIPETFLDDVELFQDRFGYVEQNSEKFKVDLKTVRPMLDEMLDFEKILADNKNFEHCKFMKAGSYLYFRACLIDRWEKLNEFGTYTYMISPLKI